jgi:hypothetical protein
MPEVNTGGKSSVARPDYLETRIKSEFVWDEWRKADAGRVAESDKLEWGDVE